MRKHPATISRELRRAHSVGERSPLAGIARAQGRGYRRAYSAKWCQRDAERLARRPKVRRLDHAQLRDKVWELLRADWSPEPAKPNAVKPGLVFESLFE